MAAQTSLSTVLSCGKEDIVLSEELLQAIVVLSAGSHEGSGLSVRRGCVTGVIKGRQRARTDGRSVKRNVKCIVA